MSNRHNKGITARKYIANLGITATHGRGQSGLYSEKASETMQY